MTKWLSLKRAPVLLDDFNCNVKSLIFLFMLPFELVAYSYSCTDNDHVIISITQ
jgi:hypothetical protein